MPSRCPRPVPELTGRALELFERCNLTWETPAAQIDATALWAAFNGECLDTYAQQVEMVDDESPLRRIVERHSPLVVPVGAWTARTPLRCAGCGHDYRGEQVADWPCEDYQDALAAAGIMASMAEEN